MSPSPRRTRWFNIAGPCFPDEHYMIPPARRVDEALALLEQGRWFVLIAGRQTGKTTAAQWIAAHLRGAGRHLALWVDLEAAREQPDITRVMPIVINELARATLRDAPDMARPSKDDLDAMLRIPETALRDYLSALARAAGKPLVLLFDEADTLAGAAMVSFLTQLRALYLDRHATPAPWSVVLLGQRAVRDYALETEDRRAVAWLATASPFNVTVESVSLAPFTEGEVAELLAQHTAETGQRFAPEAVAKIYALGQGHPWLTNALADQCTRRDVHDRAVSITATHVDAAKETLILERRTHVDSLMARLREERVRRVLDPMIAGLAPPSDLLDDDVAYVVGLGLCRIAERECVVANPIYREVIPRALTYVQQLGLVQRTAWYVRPDGRLDVPKLMAAWQEFWREDGHLAAEGFAYKESGPHLMLMAFLQRIVNGGGRIDREYALGKDALDLLVTWKSQRIALELKIWRRPTTEAKGLVQLGRYLDALGLDEGWLVIFRNDPALDWDERIFTRSEVVGSRTFHVVGC